VRGERIVAVVAARRLIDLVPRVGDRRAVGAEIVLDVRVVVLSDLLGQIARRVEADGGGPGLIETGRQRGAEGVLRVSGLQVGEPAAGVRSRLDRADARTRAIRGRGLRARGVGGVLACRRVV